MQPLISKPLSQTDIQVRFSVPMESLDAFGIPKDQNKIDLEAIDIEEKLWKFRISKRTKDVHPKPVFSAGWRAYVQHKGLQKNDTLMILHGHDEEKKRRYQVRAMRKAFRLFGQDILVDVEKLARKRIEDGRMVVNVVGTKVLPREIV